MGARRWRAEAKVARSAGRIVGVRARGIAEDATALRPGFDPGGKLRRARPHRPFGGGDARRIALDFDATRGRSVPISGMFRQLMGTRKPQSARSESSMPSDELPPTTQAPGMDSWKQVRILVSDADRRKVFETAAPPPSGIACPPNPP